MPATSRSTLAEALALDRGVIFVSAHLGPFEYIAAAIEELGLPASIVVRESYDPKLDAHVDTHRRQRGIEVIHRGRPGAPRRIVRALREGRPVGLLPDLGARVPSRWVPFLGGRALLPVGPARLAARLSVPVVVGTLEPAADGDGFSLHIQRITGSSEDALFKGLADALADRVRTSPTQWLWMGAKSLAIAESGGAGLDLWTVRTPG